MVSFIVWLILNSVGTVRIFSNPSTVGNGGAHGMKFQEIFLQRLLSILRLLQGKQRGPQTHKLREMDSNQNKRTQTSNHSQILTLGFIINANTEVSLHICKYKTSCDMSSKRTLKSLKRSNTNNKPIFLCF